MEFDLGKINLDFFAENGWVISDDFFSQAFAADLLNELLALWSDGEFFKAGIGKGIEFQKKAEIRSDYIHWLSDSGDTPLQKMYLRSIEDISQLFRRNFFLPIRYFETHFAVFPEGSFYNRHLDQFRETSTRLVTVILYLNKNWQVADGGQLRIYTGDESQDIEPLFGRLLLFRSDLIEHAVLKTNKPRYSITGWLRRETTGVIEL